ncbi:MAG: RNA 2',3'-cyclic phosphodiesterase [Planctomycetota bacterium]
MQSFRTFVGIALPADWSRPVARLIQRCEAPGDGVRWVPQDNLHLTLKFLGDVENTEVPAVCDIAANACESVEPFELAIRGGGGIPSNDRPRVLALKLDDPSERLRKLVQALELGFAEIGIRQESRDYVPHLTIGRARGGSRRVSQTALDGFLAAADSVRGEMCVDEVRVVASFLDKGGASYQTLDTVAIGRS